MNNVDQPNQNRIRLEAASDIDQPAAPLDQLQATDPFEPSADVLSGLSLGESSIIEALNNGWGEHLFKAIAAFKLTPDQLNHPNIAAAAIRCLRDEAFFGDTSALPEKIQILSEFFGLEPSDVDPIVSATIKRLIDSNRQREVVALTDLYAPSEKSMEDGGVYEAVANRLGSSKMVSGIWEAESVLSMIASLELPDGALKGFIETASVEFLLEKLLTHSLQPAEVNKRKTECDLLISVTDPEQACLDGVALSIMNDFVDRGTWYYDDKRYLKTALAMEVLKPSPDTFQYEPSLASRLLRLRNHEKPLYSEFACPVAENELPQLFQQTLESLASYGYTPALSRFIENTGLTPEQFQTKEAKKVGFALLERSIREQAGIEDDQNQSVDLAEIKKIFDLNDADLARAARQVVLASAGKGNFQEADQVIKQMDLTGDTKLIEKFENAVWKKVSKYNSPWNRFCRIMRSEEEFGGRYLKQYLRLACGVVGLSSPLVGFAGMVACAVTGISAVPILMIVGSCGAAFGSVVCFIVTDEYSYGAPAKQRKSVKLAEQLVGLKLSDRIKSNSKVQAGASEQIGKAFELGDFMLAEGVAKAFGQSIKGNPCGKSIIENRLAAKTGAGNQGIEDLLNALEVLEPPETDLRELAASKNFVNICSNLLLREQYEVFEQLADSFKLNQQEIRKIVVKAAFYPVSVDSFVRSKVFLLVDEYQLTKEDFPEGYFEASEKKVLTGLVERGKISEAEQFRDLAGSDPAVCTSHQMRSAVTRALGNWQCPKSCEEIERLFSFVQLDLNNEEDPGVQEIKKSAEKWIVHHLEQNRYDQAILLCQALDIDTKSLQKNTLGYTEQILRQAKLPAIKCYAETFLQDVSIANEPRLRTVIKERAFKEVTEGDPELAEYLVELGEIDAVERLERILWSCREKLHGNAYRMISEDLFGNWGLDEDITVDQLFPREMPRFRQTVEDIKKAGHQTLGEVVEAGIAKQRETQQYPVYGGNGSRFHSQSSVQLAKRISTNEKAVFADYDVPYHPQVRSFACGAASARMALEAMMGRKFTEKEIVGLLGTNFDDGTPLRFFHKLEEHFEELECVTAEEGSPEQMQKLMEEGYLVLVNFSPGGPHYAVVMGIDPEGLLLNDPAAGEKVAMSVKDFVACWRGGYVSTVKTERGFVALKLRPQAVEQEEV